MHRIALTRLGPQHAGGRTLLQLKGSSALWRRHRRPIWRMKSTQRWKEQQPVIQALDRNVQRVISVQPPSQNFINLCYDCQTTGEARGGVRAGLIAKLMQGYCFLFLHRKGWKTEGAEISTAQGDGSNMRDTMRSCRLTLGCDADDSQSKHDTAGLKVLNSVFLCVFNTVQCLLPW